MMRALKTAARRFRRKEDGHATIEFVIVFPAVLLTMLAGIELSLVGLHQSMLERALDVTVRDIRLGTNTNPEYDEEVAHDVIKDTICERAGFINDCSTNLRLEMIQLDPFQPFNVPADVDCINTAEEAKPVRSFVNGQSNELMILRACAKINPVFPTSVMGKTLVNGSSDGKYPLVAISVFVQEPQ